MNIWGASTNWFWWIAAAFSQLCQTLAFRLSIVQTETNFFHQRKITFGCDNVFVKGYQDVNLLSIFHQLKIKREVSGKIGQNMFQYFLLNVILPPWVVIRCQKYSCCSSLFSLFECQSFLIMVWHFITKMKMNYFAMKVPNECGDM